MTSSTILSAASYLGHLRAEGNQLADVADAADLDRPVPTCPGWTVRDAVVHTGEVFAHKGAVLKLGRRPESGEWPVGPPAGTAPVKWYRQQLDDLLTGLAERDPTEPIWTWEPDSQHVGFWYRRMAHEVAVHRVDVEDGAGVPIAPLPAALVADGVDELLTAFASGDWGSDDDDPALTGQRVDVRAGQHRWTVTLQRRRLDTTPGATEGAEAWVRCPDAQQVLLYLWGRRSTEGIDRGGDPMALEGFRRRLYLVTSD